MEQLKQLQSREEELRDLQDDKAREEGKRDQLLKNLKDQFGVDNVQEAQDLLDTKSKEYETMKTKIAGLATEIDTAFEGKKT